MKKKFECTCRENHHFLHLVWCSDRINCSFLLTVWADKKSLQGQNKECSRDLTVHRIYVAADHHPIQKHLAREVCLASTSNFHQSEMSRDQKALRAEGNLCLWVVLFIHNTQEVWVCIWEGRGKYKKVFFKSDFQIWKQIVERGLLIRVIKNMIFRFPVFSRTNDN